MPTTASFGNVLTNGTASTTFSITDTGGTSSDSYTGAVSNNGVTVSPLSGNASTAGPNSATATLNANANGSGTNNSSASWTYTITNTANTSDTGGNKTVTVSAVVGNAPVYGGNLYSPTGSSTYLFGPTFSSTAVNGSSYDGLASNANSQMGTNLGGPLEHTVAIITQGQNGSGGTNTVSMAWRNRVQNETPNGEGGNPTNSPLGFNRPLISDVVSLSLGENPAAATDPYALQMTYDGSTIGNAGAQASAGAAGLLYLATLVPNAGPAGGGQAGSDEWLLATYDDFGVGGSAQFNVASSYSAWALANGVTDANLGNFVGSYGYDVADGEVWAVVNHDSQFAVVPEPAAGALAALGLMGLLVLGAARRWSRRVEAAARGGA